MRVRRLAWVALLVAVVAALAVGSGIGRGGPESPVERADRLAHQVRCPTCQGLSAAESDARAANAVRDEIRQRVDAGQADGEILAFLASRYGNDILLMPDGQGVSALVWALPVAALVMGAGGVFLAFRRWREPLADGPAPTPEDRAMVAMALRDSDTEGGRS